MILSENFAKLSAKPLGKTLISSVKWEDYKIF